MSSVWCEPSSPAREHAAKPTNKTTSNSPRHLSIRSPIHVRRAERKSLAQQASRPYFVSTQRFASRWFFLVKPRTSGSPPRLLPDYFWDIVGMGVSELTIISTSLGRR
jgi:hypothetical protein